MQYSVASFGAFIERTPTPTMEDKLSSSLQQMQAACKRAQAACKKILECIEEVRISLEKENLQDAKQLHLVLGDFQDKYISVVSENVSAGFLLQPKSIKKLTRDFLIVRTSYFSLVLNAAYKPSKIDTLINRFGMFSLPRPPETTNLEDKVVLKGAGMLRV